MTALTRTPRIAAIRFEQDLLLHQLWSFGRVAIAAFVVLLMWIVFPKFFVYPYFFWSGWEAVLKFWPMYLWGISLNLIVVYFAGRGWPIRARDSAELLGWEVLTSTLAGVWEELGYRWAFIIYAMIGIAISNFIFGAGLGWFMVAICFFATVGFAVSRMPLGAACALGLGVLAALFAVHANPIFWLREIGVWIVHIMTLTLADNALYSTNDRLLIFGALLANIWFRDGHKYQGPLGIVNAWYMGIVLLYATVIYGLWTAIVVHAVYDIVISVQRFLMQRTR